MSHLAIDAAHWAFANRIMGLSLAIVVALLAYGFIARKWMEFVVDKGWGVVVGVGPPMIPLIAALYLFLAWLGPK